MEKTFEWQQKGRESLHLTLQYEDSHIVSVEMKAIGGLDFLKMSQDMKKSLHGPVSDLKVPSGHSSSEMIWREIILQIQEKWQLPVANEELCHCRKVSTAQVDSAIVYGAHSLEEVRRQTSANTGCGTCKNDVEQLIQYRLNHS